MDFSLNAYIKYCLGYLSLTKPAGANRGTSLDIILAREDFSLNNFINGETDGNFSETVGLDLYYGTDPKDVSEEIRSAYERERKLALELEEMYGKAKNDTFTKETILRFGRFDFEVAEHQTLEAEDGEALVAQEDPAAAIEPEEEGKLISKPFYLFSLPVRIEKEKDASNIDRYSIVPADVEVRLNLPSLHEIFRTYKKEDLVYEFLHEYVVMENEGCFSIPIPSEETFLKTWHLLKAKLKLTDAHFNEESFTLDDVHLTLAPRANFFLVEDLTKLSREEETSLEGTSLSGWFSTDGLNVPSESCEEKELYFPFPYDKFQRATTSLLKNKASIIQGPPGTGKSETITNLMCHLAVNKNRVLFVSQKPQALRVVKDKLKSLEVPLLFGYIPSVKFENAQDEEGDTISSQLSALDTYGADKGGARSAADLEVFTKEKADYFEKRDQAIALEREVFALEERKRAYAFLDALPAFDEEKFATNFTDELYRSYEDSLQKEVANELLIQRPDAKLNPYSYDKRLFSGTKISDAVRIILEDLKETGFDRSSSIGRFFNNFGRKLRHGDVLDRLPKELFDVIDQALKKDLSRLATLTELEPLLSACLYQEAIIENERLQAFFEEVDRYVGLSKQDVFALQAFLKERQRTVGQLRAELADHHACIAQQTALKQQIADLKKQADLPALTSRKRIVAQYLKNVVDENICKNIVQVPIYRKLQELQKAFKKSKKAFKTFDKLKSDPTNFEAILNIVPIWIMDLDDASRLIPLVANLFDYVVFDEASQCNIAYTIPSMYRSKKALFVGDPEQMRDTTIMFKSNQAFDQLAARFKVPEALQIKPTGTAVQSVLDIAKTRFGVPKILQYHYRSPMELIGFSNTHFYEPKGKRLIALNNKYLTYKDTNRIMVLHPLAPTGVGENGDSTNHAEALKVLELYKEMSVDPRYEGKSFAILTFFNAQAELIRKVFEANRLKESDKLKIAIIEGIQGDEKDIVIYSFVIRDPSQKRQYSPLTGEGGDIRADINAGRVNVAFSRAKRQVHCIYSLPIEQIPSGIWIKKYLEHVRDNGEVSASKLQLKGFDSYFEEEFYHLLKSRLGDGYVIQNQVESCGFKIDFVVTNLATGAQLAIECDGPTHFKDHLDESYGIYVDSDIQRQQVLESAGWTFFRVGYSEWIESDERKEAIISEVGGSV